MYEVVSFFARLRIDKETIIDLLQKYKKSLQILMERRIHLYIDEDGEIHVEGAFKNDEYQKVKTFTALKVKDFNTLIMDGIPKDIVNSIVILKLIDEWMSILTTKEKIALFHAYINHDFEKDGKRYKTLSIREISKKMNLPKSTVYDLIRKSLMKILQYNI
ncbi:hypothetical protein SAMN02745164_00502 [Marinitoga hydrogenitolerans DSM 16785]|uniref:Uncharacterized protein n=1 Tax=Marinitoga hydrogenitolerans (strain DSM 16785 / JCM 12826 / AT1271) TaxID=1122195 RepID=A0A1M4TTR6_MARH1|nr:sigma-70 family RNA polymerase sigma factor [Marinitoga hydrogenitolerans]SHE47697.1 hypothetical protein SAMN02745164_00502 [Marinitoga hydrogenitolerans DSM 16785]